MKKPPPTSCGTLVINPRGEVLLCHLTGTRYWDLPKGLQDPGESPLQAAQRELFEETGLAFDPALFEDIGDFDFRPDKRLHLFKVLAGDGFDSLDQLACSSHFAHRATGKPTPEVDAYRWASRDQVAGLCGPRMAARLAALPW